MPRGHQDGGGHDGSGGRPGAGSLGDGPACGRFRQKLETLEELGSVGADVVVGEDPAIRVDLLAHTAVHGVAQLLLLPVALASL